MHATVTRAVSAVVVSASLVVPAGAPEAIAAEPPPVVPTDGTHLGAQVNLRYGLDQYDSIVRFEQQIGRKLAIVNRFHPWSKVQYRQEARHVADGRIPLISWRATDDKPDANRARKIASGQYDALIRRHADAINELRGPVLVRWNWEMDQRPGARQYIGEPSDFVAAWRRIVGIFRQRGADNAQFVWAPRANSFNKGTGQQYYPGDRWVDWIGGSAVPLKAFRDFDTIFEGLHRWGAGRGKPLLAWIGAQERPGDPNWKRNFLRGADEALRERMTGFRAFVYYHALSPKGYEFWADTTPQAFGAFRAMACSAHLNAPPRCG